MQVDMVAVATVDIQMDGVKEEAVSGEARRPVLVRGTKVVATDQRDMVREMFFTSISLPADIIVYMLRIL